jgi:phosphatidylserine/phosphatidylglycerophosphate/cardiolipin synthase-like enzyme
MVMSSGSWRQSLVLVGLIACERTSDTPAPLDPGDGTGIAHRTADLWLAPTDAWAHPLPDATLSLDRALPSAAQRDASSGILRLGLGDVPFTFTVDVVATDHDPLHVELAWSGTMLTSDDPRVVIATRDDGARPAFAAVLLADHAWLAASGPSPSNNDATLLRDGEAYWAAVADDLDRTTERVTWTTWWWESDFELIRGADHATTTAAAREANTVLTRLTANGAVRTRSLINLFGDVELAGLLNTDTALRARAEDAADAFEAVLQANTTDVPLFSPYEAPETPIDRPGRVRGQPSWQGWMIQTESPRALTDGLTAPAASWHQKAIVLDGATAFVSGMNTKGTDWDDGDHDLHDARRMAFDADNADRLDVAAGEAFPTFGPRKDYGIRLAGPAAHDVETLLADRWNRALDAGAPYADQATPLTTTAPEPEPTEGVLSQIVATLPAPWSLRAIADTHDRAFRQATSLIYIEDQYFRAPLLLDALLTRMVDNPEVRLVVVTKPVSDLDPGAQHTFAADAQLRAMFPDRYLALQLRSVDLYLDEGFFFDTVAFESGDIDVHSKLRIVDDRYLSVGSCNFNNRGYLYEGELNAVVFDDAWVADARRDVFANLLGAAWQERYARDDQALFEALRSVAASNQATHDWWTQNAGDLDVDEATAERATRWPVGFVYPLGFSDAYTFDVGTDAF